MHTTKENGPNNNITLNVVRYILRHNVTREHTHKKNIHLHMAFIIVQCIGIDAKVVRGPDVTGILPSQRP